MLIFLWLLLLLQDCNGFILTAATGVRPVWTAVPASWRRIASRGAWRGRAATAPTATAITAAASKLTASSTTSTAHRSASTAWTFQRSDVTQQLSDAKSAWWECFCSTGSVRHLTVLLWRLQSETWSDNRLSVPVYPDEEYNIPYNCPSAAATSQQNGELTFRNSKVPFIHSLIHYLGDLKE